MPQRVTAVAKTKQDPQALNLLSELLALAELLENVLQRGWDAWQQNTWLNNVNQTTWFDAHADLELRERAGLYMLHLFCMLSWVEVVYSCFSLTVPAFQAEETRGYDTPQFSILSSVLPQRWVCYDLNVVIKNNSLESLSLEP